MYQIHKRWHGDVHAVARPFTHVQPSMQMTSDDKTLLTSIAIVAHLTTTVIPDLLRRIHVTVAQQAAVTVVVVAVSVVAIVVAVVAILITLLVLVLLLPGLDVIGELHLLAAGTLLGILLANAVTAVLGAATVGLSTAHCKEPTKFTPRSAAISMTAYECRKQLLCSASSILMWLLACC